MKTIFSNHLLFLGLFLLLISCDKESGIGQFDRLVSNNPNNVNKFQQITFIASLYHPEHGYANLGKIDSLQIFVNARQWGTFSSELADTTGRTDHIAGGVPFSYEKVSYLFVAPYQLIMDNLETAGDYVAFLNGRIALTPGDYVCEMKKIKYRNLDGELIEKNIRVFADFTVIDNSSSSFVGDIEIPIQ